MNYIKVDMMINDYKKKTSAHLTNATLYTLTRHIHRDTVIILKPERIGMH